jgi:ribonuclease D
MHRQDLQTNSCTTDADTFNQPSDHTIEAAESKKIYRFPERLDKEHIKTLPLRAFDGKIHLITDIKDVNAAIKTLRQYPILGFDTETRPTFKKGVQHSVSLLQLSTPKEAYLFRLNHLGFPEELILLLEDPGVLKVGVAILDDVRGLQKLSNFNAAGFVELADIASSLGIVTCGLRNLAAIFFGVRITKKAQLTNWERPVINSKQCLYAATDAWICLEMYHFLERENLLPENIIWHMPESHLKNSNMSSENNKQ